MKKTELMNKVTRTFGKAGLCLKKHSPEILVVTGVVGVVASAVLACKATIKANTIVKDTKKNVEKINYCLEHPEKLEEPYTLEDHKKDLTIVHTKAGLQLAKTYAPAIALGALSITCIFAGNHILRKRNIALAAAYTTIDNSFKNYRQRVVERFGEDLDKELRYNIKTKEVEETVVDENGNEKKVKKTMHILEDGGNDYARFFDETCAGWQKDADFNRWFVLQQQNFANDKLKANGYLFLNDVYESLGIPKTKAGQIVGWLYKKGDGDGFVDFGIYDPNDDAKRAFINGHERSILLDFNVDGPILDLL